MSRPATNAPNTASNRSAWVPAAHSMMRTTVEAISGPFSRARPATHSTERTTGRPTTAATTTTATRLAIANPTAPAHTPVVAIAETTASSIQPTMSSTAAEANVSWPTLRWSSFMSGQDLGDDRDRGHAHGHAEERCEDKRLHTRGLQRRWQREAGGHAQTEWQHETGQPDPGHSGAAATQQPEVHL
jgi:hypothetical protein